ncbi:Inner membrane symporter YicJ [[Ruminococcus] torques]|uniref:Inner membrane symporter YicJ n=1 Tax=[Ruminococcus] torques TaxID=33039 RepID=A0A564SZ62_9FIRM|nr:glycoside-pentoside-hexuronide (GPH):cation symporter [[Ruminococcus] torques]VUX00488.1 Inner membrane symporter YicJ [[Ruminococcus] torques]
MKLFTNSDNPKTSLGFVERCAIGFGNFGNSFIFAAISAFLIFYYTDVVGLNPAIIGTLLLVSRLFDGVTDVAMGHIVDRTHSKYGKARCYILWMSIPFAICSCFLFAVPTNISVTLQYIYVFISYNLVCSLLYTALSVPFQTLSCLVTENQYERGLFGVFTMLFATVGVMIVNSFTLGLVDYFGGTARAWTITIAIFAVIGLAAHMFCFFNVKERVGDLPTEDSNPDAGLIDSVRALFYNSYWIRMVFVTVLIFLSYMTYMAALIYYCNVSLGNIGLYAIIANICNVCEITSYVLASAAFKKFGKVKTMTTSNIIFIIVIICEFIAVSMIGNVPLIIGLTILKGFSIGMTMVPMNGIMADCVTLCEMKTGVNAKGVGISAMSVGQKCGTGLSSALFGFILAWGGYSEAATSFSDRVIFSVNFSYLLVPLICAVIIALLLFRYNLEKDYSNAIQEQEVKRK